MRLIECCLVSGAFTITTKPSFFLFQALGLFWRFHRRCVRLQKRTNTLLFSSLALSSFPLNGQLITYKKRPGIGGQWMPGLPWFFETNADPCMIIIMHSWINEIAHRETGPRKKTKIKINRGAQFESLQSSSPTLRARGGKGENSKIFLVWFGLVWFAGRPIHPSWATMTMMMMMVVVSFTAFPFHSLRSGEQKRGLITAASSISAGRPGVLLQRKGAGQARWTCIASNETLIHPLSSSHPPHFESDV